MRFGIREVIFFVILLAVPVASYLYVFKPRNAQIQEARQENTQKQQKLDELAHLQQTISDIELEIERRRHKIEALEDRLPAEQEVEVILERVWEIANKQGLTVMSVKSARPAPAALYMEQPLDMEFEGSFNGFYEFLQELENLPRITRIHRMKLERAGLINNGPHGKSAPKGHMKAEFTLSIYFEPRSGGRYAQAENTP